MQLATVLLALVTQAAALDTHRDSYTISYMKLGRQAMWVANKGAGREVGRPRWSAS
jgi:hypothetical protein